MENGPAVWGGDGGVFSVRLYLQLINLRLFSYRSSGTFVAYFGDRVAFVLCSVWLGASTDHCCCLVTYSSCTEGKFLLRAACPLLPGLSLSHPDTLYTLMTPLNPPSPLVQSIIPDSYGEICFWFF